ncbi:SH3 domain-containing protein [Clostridiaceae bacterium 35-E11]
MKCMRYVIVITLILLCALAMSVMVYAETTEEKGVVIADDVNIRQQPQVESAVISSLNIGEYVSIIDNKGEWYNIRLNNQTTGWVHNDLIIALEKDFIKKGKVNADNLNVRQEPDTTSDIIQKLDNGLEVTIVEENSDWYCVLLDKDTKGWVHADYIKTIPNYSLAIITGNSVNVRSNPSVSGNVVATISLDQGVRIKDFKDGWYHIIMNNHQEGWIHQDYIKVQINEGFSIMETTSRSTSRSSLGIKGVKIAKELLGVPYVYGASGPNSFDCSGFTSYVYKKIGINLPRTSHGQAEVGELVAKQSLRMGDLVFFDTVGKKDNAITHVGIYIGDGEFIHASSGKNAKRVVVSNLNTGYYNDKYVTARRFF